MLLDCGPNIVYFLSCYRIRMKRSLSLFSCSHAFVYFHILFKVTLLSTALLSGIRFWVLVWMIGIPVLNHIWQFKQFFIHLKHIYCVTSHHVGALWETGKQKMQNLFLCSSSCIQQNLQSLWIFGDLRQGQFLIYSNISAPSHHHVLLLSLSWCYCRYCLLFILLCKHVQSSILVKKADSDVSGLSKLCCASFFQNKLLQP